MIHVLRELSILTCTRLTSSSELDLPKEMKLAETLRSLPVLRVDGKGSLVKCDILYRLNSDFFLKYLKLSLLNANYFCLSCHAIRTKFPFNSSPSVSKPLGFVVM